MLALLNLVLLVLLVVSLPVIGGVLFAPFLLGAWLLALVGILARHGDRTAAQHQPALDGKGWRNGS